MIVFSCSMAIKELLSRIRSQEAELTDEEKLQMICSEGSVEILSELQVQSVV